MYKILAVYCLTDLFPLLRYQAVIQNPFSNGGSPGGDSVGGEARFAYFPTATVSDGTATAVSVQATADPTITQAGGEKTLHNQDRINDEQNSYQCPFSVLSVY